MGGLLDLVRLEPIKERPLPVGVLGPHRRQHPVEIADLGKEFLQVDEHRAAEPPQVTELPAHLPLCALHADPLAAVPDSGRLIDRHEPVLQLAEPADVDPRRRNLEIGEERLELRALRRKEHRGTAEQGDEVPGRGWLELLAAPAHLEVLRPLTLRGRGQVDEPRAFDAAAFDEQQFIRAFLGLDDDFHDGIRSWIV